MSRKKIKSPGWPVLSRPSKKPRNVRDVLLLMFVLNELLVSNQPVKSIPRRTIQRCMFIAGGKRLSGHLKRLSEEGWLTQIRSDQIGKGYDYGPGTLLLKDSNLHFDWSALSSQVFGPNGLLRELIDSSARCYGFLNNSGALCLAVIHAADVPVQPKALKEYLSPILSPAAVTRSLKKLKTLHLVVKEPCGYSVSENWREILRNFELQSGSSARSSKIHVSTRAETIKFQKKQHLGVNRAKGMNWRYGKPAIQKKVAC